MLAAIAYASHDNLELFEACKTYGKNLTFYGRYDQSVPVHPAVVKWFLDNASPNYVCRMVPDILHAKVIWWVDVGAYIGSANLTDRAWNSNIEAGVFLTQDELEDMDMTHQLQQFFHVVDSRSHPVNDEFYKHLLELSMQRTGIDRAEHEFRKKAKRFFPEAASLNEVSSLSGSEKAYQRFEQAWRESLQALRNVSNFVVRDEYRPHWIPANTPKGVQADQFIHAYYYKSIKGHLGKEFVDNAHIANKGNPQKALVDALEWWKESDFDYSDEERHVTDWAPQLKADLARSSLQSLSPDKFIEALSKVHAIRDYAGKRRNSDFGRTALPYEDKLTAHLNEVWSLKSKGGKTAIDLLEYVIWGAGPIEKRIWRGVNSEEWRIPMLGYSALGEIVGWARPDEYPPRNDRSIKGLQALGQRVRSV